MTALTTFDREIERLDEIYPFGLRGRVDRVVGLAVAASGFPAPLGAQCRIVPRGVVGPVDVEVVGFQGGQTLLMPYAELRGVRRGDPVVLQATSQQVAVGEALLGRVLNGRGEIVDAGEPLELTERVPLDRGAPDPLRRPRIDEPLSTGIRAIDSLLTVGKGQRVGIFSGTGVGKSVLLGMMARHTKADVNVVALVGERGREVRDFIEKDLGPEGLSRTVLVVSTSNEPALTRVKAAMVASAVAEFFRDRGADVLLMMDSVTRVATAQREIGLATGEPPTTRGYCPSVFALLPRLLERSGRAPTGSITGFYAVLVEADDPTEPIGDAVRGILDGHIWLSRDLASRSHYPAISIHESISRLMVDLVDEEHLRQARGMVRLWSDYESAYDLISIGAYVRGSDPEIDQAIDLRPRIAEHLTQQIDEKTDFEEGRRGLAQLAESWAKLQEAQSKAASRSVDGQGVAP